MRLLLPVMQEPTEYHARERDHDTAHDGGSEALNLQVGGEGRCQPEHGPVDDEGEEAEREQNYREGQKLDHRSDQEIDETKDECHHQDLGSPTPERDAAYELTGRPESGCVDQQSQRELSHVRLRADDGGGGPPPSIRGTDRSCVAAPLDLGAR